MIIVVFNSKAENDGFDRFSRTWKMDRIEVDSGNEQNDDCQVEFIISEKMNVLEK